MMRGLSAWQNREAFQYTEQLDGPLLAWEYLRKNSAYRAAWAERNSSGSDTPGRDWGLLRLIDPATDARSANPIWQPDPPSTLRIVRASAAKQGLKFYDLQIERAPYMVRDDQGTYGTASMKSNSWRIHVADGLADDDWIAIAIPVDEFARRRVAAADRFIVDLKAKSAETPKHFSASNRADRFHSSVLQALDGAAARATHRQIAVAIYGQRRVSASWTPDGDLRARIRYFLKRGSALVNGGYRKLIYC
jgi:hypothetical protein